MSGTDRLRELLDQGTAVAVTGMAVRLPGARNVASYWANLRAGTESIRDIPEEELKARGVPQELLDDPAYVRRAATLEGMDRFDAGFFGFSPRDAAILDPQHRHFLEVAWEALEDAGRAPGRFDGSVGVFAGSGTNAYFWANLLTNAELVRDVGFFLLRHTGNDKDFLSTRVSYAFDLKGPSVNVQTACSTSLVAVHMAVQSLLTGECDMALAGGVTIEQPHGLGYLHREGEILSPDGRCRPFDSEAGGTVFGSGVGVVVLRRLEDAVDAGDPLHAVILGSAVNNDGSGKVGYLAPSVEGQARAIAEALGAADVDPGTIGFVAAHGTGTGVGDPIEVEALTRAFRTGTSKMGYARLGSVKANIGHADTAAGVASMVQAICALKAAEIPPVVHFRDPNPALELESSPFRIPSTLEPWMSDGPRRAGVNSLGVGGTNAFLLLEEAPVPPPPAPPRRPVEILPLSARSPRALEAASGDLADFLEGEASPGLPDAAYTLAVGRRGFRHRRAVVGATAQELVAALVTRTPTGVVGGEARDPQPPVTFLFAGGGSQYPGMGRGLHATEPTYRSVVDACLEGLDPEVAAPVRAFLQGERSGEGEGGVEERPLVALPALFMAQLAQAHLWLSWGIRPASLLGHSMGEYTAACLSGVLSRDDALRLVVVRARLFESLGAGGMLSVGLSEDALRARLPAGLSVAAVNAPELSVASGPVELLDELATALRSEEIECRRVKISVAAHSGMLDPILGAFEAELRGMALHPPRIPFPSNLSGDWITPEEATDPGYWVRHLRETVRFADGIRAVAGAQGGLLLEVGPGRTLATLARLNLAGNPAIHATTSMRHPEEGDDDVRVQLRALGELWCRGVEVDWEALYRGEGRRRVSLPTYPFEGERHFFDPGSARPLALGPDPVAGTDRMASEAPDRWLYRRAWEEAPLEPATEGRPGDRASAPILVVGAEPGPVVRAIEGRGRHALGVTLGAPGAAPDDSRQVKGNEADGWRHLFEELDDEGRPPSALIYLPLFETSPLSEGERGGGSADAATLGARRRLAFDTLLALAQALGEGEGQGLARLLVPATRLHRVQEGDGVDPWKSLVLGPVRVMPRELPWIEARAIDLEDPAENGLPGAVDTMLAELDDGGTHPVVAWRNGERWVPRFTPLPMPPTPTDALTTGAKGGTWVITGGLGGVGLAIARGLAEEGASTLLLLGRTELPPREDWLHWTSLLGEGHPAVRRIRGVQAMEELGCRVVVAAANVTDADALREVLARHLDDDAPVVGLVHAAGVLADAPILAKELGGAHAVLAPKTEGTMALFEAIGGRSVDKVILFSSRSATAGLAGQVDYTSANAFLDAWAEARPSGGLPRVISVGWDLWSQVGMAFDLAQGGGAADPSPASIRALEHPLFHYHQVFPDGEHRYLARVGVNGPWMIEEHRLRSGARLVPGAGFVELLHEALSLRKGPGPLTFEEVLFLAPLLVPEGETREIAVRLRPGRAGRVLLSVLGRRGPGEDWTEHVRGAGFRGRGSGEEPISLRRLRRHVGRRTREVGGAPPSPIMRFGARWACLRSVRIGEREALLEVELPSRFRDDLAGHPLHAALLDVATGSLQAFLDEGRRGGEGPPLEGIHVPASYGTIRVLAPLVPRLHVHVREREEIGEDTAMFDVSLLDEEGRVRVVVEDFVMVRIETAALEDAAGHGVGIAPPGAGPERADGGASLPLERGLTTAEGVALFHRIVSLPDPPGLILVAKGDPNTHPAERMNPEGGPPNDPPADVSPVIDALLEHPAIADATAIAHRYGGERPRVVAFVVHEQGHAVTVSEVRRYLRERVDGSLVPQNFVDVQEIPRDARGRVDRSRLADPFAPGDTHVAPRTASEEVVAEIWRALLGLDRVGVHDNFLDVGGHSLVGIRALLQIERRTGVRLHPNALTLQTLEQIAADLDRRLESPDSDESSGPGRREGGFASRLLGAVRGPTSRS